MTFEQFLDKLADRAQESYITALAILVVIIAAIGVVSVMGMGIMIGIWWLCREAGPTVSWSVFGIIFFLSCIRIYKDVRA